MKHHYNKILVLLLLCTPLILLGQTKKAFIKAGDQAMKEENFYAAMNYFEQAVEFAGNKIPAHYKLAEAAYAYRAYDYAIQHFRQVLASSEKETFPLAQFKLAQSYYAIGNYKKAIFHFDVFQQQSANQLYKQKALRKIEEAQWAIQICADPDSVEIIRLGKNINSPFSEFAPFKKGDTLFFSAYRYNEINKIQEQRRKISKIVWQKGRAKARPIRGKLNDPQRLTAHTSFSKDGRKIFYTLCNYEEGSHIRCDIYSRTLDPRGRWKNPKKLAAPINRSGTSSTHPMVAFNFKDEKDYLLFSSDRVGGKGDMDIYAIEMKNKGFGELINIVQVNTDKDDITPFYEPVSKTLYFSSKGRKSLGAFDIYKTQQDKGVWMDVQHLAYPINSSYDEIYFMMIDSSEVYMASNREGALYIDKKNKACCNDIFKLKLFPKAYKVPEDSLPVVSQVNPNLIPPSPVIEKEDFFKDTSSVTVLVAKDTTVQVKPPLANSVKDSLLITPPSLAESLNEMLPLPLYFHNDRPNPRTWQSHSNVNYEETLREYELLLKEYLNNGPPSEKAAIQSFFDEKLKKNFQILKTFAHQLYRELQHGNQFTIEIQGYTSPRATTPYNELLGKRRANSVQNFLMHFDQQKLKTYFQNGQLKITLRSKGESTAPSSVSAQLDQAQFSIYSLGAMYERRVSIVNVIKR